MFIKATIALLKQRAALLKQTALLKQQALSYPDAPAAGAASAAASAVRIYYVIIGGRFAPPYKYMIKYIQQKQQRQQHQNLFWQFIQSMKNYIMNCQPTRSYIMNCQVWQFIM